MIAAGNENLVLRKSQGFQMIAVGLDGPLMIRSIRDALAAAGISAAAPTTAKYGA